MGLGRAKWWESEPNPQSSTINNNHSDNDLPRPCQKRGGKKRKKRGKKWAQILVTADVGWLVPCPREETLSSARVAPCDKVGVGAMLVLLCVRRVSACSG